MPLQWMPLLGEFSISAKTIIFKGRTYPPLPAPTATEPAQVPQPPQAAVGLLLSDQVITSGTLSATIDFAEVSPNSVCEIVVGYDAKTRRMTTGGLGGNFWMFGIRGWEPTPLGGPQSNVHWLEYGVIGDRSNLKPKTKYAVSFRIDGSAAVLKVDGVEVINTILPAGASVRGQVGLFCSSEAEITVTEFMLQSERPSAFVVMQFSPPYDGVYSSVITDICAEFGVDARRADEIYGPGIIIRDIIERIERAQIIIADISPPNPNVYFEVGYALALGKPIILLAQRRGPESPLPFDLSAFRVLFYDDSITGKQRLEDGLRNPGDPWERDTGALRAQVASWLPSGQETMDEPIAGAIGPPN